MSEIILKGLKTQIKQQQQQQPKKKKKKKKKKNKHKNNNNNNKKKQQKNKNVMTISERANNRKDEKERCSKENQRKSIYSSYILRFVYWSIIM